jgi:hypothetical protein
MNGGLIDIILEVVSTAEQRAERAKAVEDSQIRSTMTKEKEYEIQEKYGPAYPEALGA